MRKRWSRYLFFCACAFSLHGVISVVATRADETSESQENAISEIKRLGGEVLTENREAGKPVISIDLKGAKIGDADLAHVTRFPMLQTLHLDYTSITDAGLKQLRGLNNLRRLSLHDTKITDAGLEHLKGLKELRLLRLDGTNVTAEGVDQLKQSLPNAKIFR